MGFTILSYSLSELPPVSNIYVSIHGSYEVTKTPLNNPDIYCVSFNIYFHANSNSRVISSYKSSFNIQTLPNQNLYSTIYDYIKGQLDPYYLSNQQVLTYTDD